MNKAATQPTSNGKITKNCSIHLSAMSTKNTNLLKPDTSKKFVFKVHYAAAYGDNVGVVLYTNNTTSSSKWVTSKPLIMPLTWTINDIWIGEYELPISQSSIRYTYKYVVMRTSNAAVEPGRNIIRWESRPERELITSIGSGGNVIEFRDSWHNVLVGCEKVFTSSAFTEVLFAPNDSIREIEYKNIPKGKIAVIFEMKHQLAKSSHHIMLSGNCSALGNWDTNAAISLIRQKTIIGSSTVFKAVVYMEKEVHFPFEYKMFSRETCEESNTTKIVWEEGDNRKFEFDYELNPSSVVIRDPIPFHRSFKGAGVSVPVFSLRTNNSLGVGEFADISLLVDWSHSAGYSIIQLLPVNSTVIHKTWWDSNPYSSLSVFALHPIYINIELLEPSQKVLDIVNKNKEALNKGFVDYEKVMFLKTKLLKLIFEEKKTEFLESDEFAQYLEENKDWLPAYALFCYLRDINGTADFYSWPKYKDITQAELDEMTKPTVDYYDSIAFEYFVQFQLSKQLTEVSEYAKSKGIILKGDLPIGVDKHSVDTWFSRKNFNIEFQAGSPPDDFSCDGQNWSFPTYNWEAMKEDAFYWWRRRLQIMSKYFHAYRIDHILGFFRIWQNPKSCEGGLLGYFHPSLPIPDWELHENGIRDIERLTNPYVTWDHLNSIFPHDSVESIIDKYFDRIPDSGHLNFKQHLSTEVQLSKAIKSLESEGFAKFVKDNLFTLLRNIILMKVPSEKHDSYHMRINCIYTDSFNQLPENIKSAIHRLYFSYFYERQDELWRNTALERFSMMLDASNMMICGEDLGMIPGCVQSVIDELSILGLRVQRMPKGDEEFEDLNKCPYMTVASPTTHDTSTLRSWWEQDRAKTERFYWNYMHESGPPPYFCEPWIVEKIINQHLGSSSMWAIFPIQDVFAISSELRLHENPQDERINMAGVVHYWRYRIPFNLEDLIQKHTDFTNKIMATNKSFGRVVE